VLLRLAIEIRLLSGHAAYFSKFFNRLTAKTLQPRARQGHLVLKRASHGDSNLTPQCTTRSCQGWNLCWP